MILRKIFTYPDLLQYPTPFTSKFRDQSRHVCTFLERHISKLKFKTEQYNKVCIIGSSHPTEIYISSSNSLIVPVYLNAGDYENLENEELPEYFISLIYAAIDRCSGKSLLPEEELLHGIELFREGGFSNKWRHQVKTEKNTELTFELMCELSIDKFQLFLAISKNKEKLLEKIILETAPDEIAYHYKFKNLHLNGSLVSIIDKNERVLYEMDFSTLLLH